VKREKDHAGREYHLLHQEHSEPRRREEEGGRRA
jgi:hypothetical protein